MLRYGRFKPWIKKGLITEDELKRLDETEIKILKDTQNLLAQESTIKKGDVTPLTKAMWKYFKDVDKLWTKTISFEKRKREENKKKKPHPRYLKEWNEFWDMMEKEGRMDKEYQKIKKGVEQSGELKECVWAIRYMKRGYSGEEIRRKLYNLA
jgi:phage terminase small subunit